MSIRWVSQIIAEPSQCTVSQRMSHPARDGVTPCDRPIEKAERERERELTFYNYSICQQSDVGTELSSESRTRGRRLLNCGWCMWLDLGYRNCKTHSCNRPWLMLPQLQNHCVKGLPCLDATFHPILTLAQIFCRPIVAFLAAISRSRPSLLLLA